MTPRSPPKPDPLPMPSQPLHHQPLHRLPDWPERLAAYLQAHRGARFAWGTHDCVTFAAGAVAAITGQALLPTASRWASARDAAVALRHRRGLAAAVDSLLPRLASPALAQRGDVLLVRADPLPAGGRHRRGHWLAVADAPGWWAPGAASLQAGGLAAAVAGWAVAHG